jgi:ribose 1,5-bisphosphokinase
LNNPATLFYLVGPSGVGKDSLLHALQEQADNRRLHVARRYITRPARRGDDQHVALSQTDFDRREGNGEFLFAWRSHGFSYAVARELLAHMEAGEDVIVNGSRAYLSTACEILPGLVPVWMQVPEAVLRERLGRRARESAAEIERRLERNQQLESVRHEKWPVIMNDGSLEQACRRFFEIREHYRLGEDRKAK